MLRREVSYLYFLFKQELSNISDNFWFYIQYTLHTLPIPEVHFLIKLRSWCTTMWYTPLDDALLCDTPDDLTWEILSDFLLMVHDHMVLVHIIIHESHEHVLFLAVCWPSHNYISVEHLILAIDTWIIHQRYVCYFYASSKWMDVNPWSPETTVLLSRTPQ